MGSLTCPVLCCGDGMWPVFALSHAPIRFCRSQSTHSAYLGQQVPDHCTCQVSLGSAGLAYEHNREKGSRQVPLNVFSSMPLFYLGDFSPGSLRGTETETLCGRCGKRAEATALLTRSLFPLQGTPLLAVGRLLVSTFSPPTSLLPHPFLPICLFSFDGHLIV